MFEWLSFQSFYFEVKHKLPLFFSKFFPRYSPNGTEVDAHRIQITNINTLTFYNDDNAGKHGGGYISSTVRQYFILK